MRLLIVSKLIVNLLIKKILGYNAKTLFYVFPLPYKETQNEKLSKRKSLANLPSRF